MVHIFSLKILTYLKSLIGIKSPDTKKYPARLTLSPVKSSSFIEGKFFPPKKRE